MDSEPMVMTRVCHDAYRILSLNDFAEIQDCSSIRSLGIAIVNYPYDGELLDLPYLESIEEGGYVNQPVHFPKLTTIGGDFPNLENITMMVAECATYWPCACTNGALSCSGSGN